MMSGESTVSTEHMDTWTRDLAEKTGSSNAGVGGLVHMVTGAAHEQSAAVGATRTSTLMCELAKVESRMSLIDNRCREPLGEGADPADQAIALTERSRSMAARQSLRLRMQQAIHALEREMRGQGNLCEVCGSRIDAGRLRVVPETSVCIECQRGAEVRLR